MIYVTSDLHGFYKEFMQMLDIINFTSDDYLYIIGDAIDRGPDSIALLQYIMKQKNMQLIMGNHEQAFLWNEYKNDGPWPDEVIHEFWDGHGGRKTKKQFHQLKLDKQYEIITYLLALPLYKIVDDFILVHAAVRLEGICYKSMEQLLKQQDPLDLLWEKDEFLTKPFVLEGNTMIYGHTFTLMIRQMQERVMDSVEILKEGSRIGIDCGYQFGGRMVMLRLDDMQAFYLSPSGIVTVKDNNDRMLEEYQYLKKKINSQSV